MSEAERRSETERRVKIERDFIWVVRGERAKQLHKRPYTLDHDLRHSTVDWVAILAHELGCLAAEALNEDDIRPALVKIAAVSLAAYTAAVAKRAELPGAEPKKPASPAAAATTRPTASDLRRADA